MTLLILKTRRPIPAVDAQAGDLVLIDPTDPDNPLGLYRSLAAESLSAVLQNLDEMEVVKAGETAERPTMGLENGERSILQVLRRRGLIA